MKNWYRAFGFTILVAMLGFGSVGAQPWPEYGSCYIFCGDQFHEISNTTYSQCCYEDYPCPNDYGSYHGFYWNSYYTGGPQICDN